jgi:ATP-binding cassette subfamily B protein
MREILKLVPELRGRLYLSAVFKVIESFFISAPYGFLVLTLNDLLSETLTTKKVILYTVGMATCFLIQGIFFYLYARVAYPIATKLCERIRIVVGEHLRKLSMEYFNNKTTGDLNALVSDELTIVGIIPRMAFPQLITAITLPMAFVPFLFFIDWRLSIVTLMVVPMAIPFFIILQKILRTGLRKRSNSLIMISSKIIEYVQGMEVVRAFSQTGKQFSKFDDVLQKFKSDNLDLVLQAVPPMMTFRTILDFGFTMILLVGAYFFLGGEITLFTFLIFLIVGLRVYEPIKSISSVFELVRIAEVTINRIRQLLDTPPLPQPVNTFVPKISQIEFKNVTFSYDETPILKNISFTIPEKSITAFVGASGAGKTTITRLIARFWDVDSGEIRIGGRNIREMNTDTLLSLLSMVFQDVYLFNDTIYTNIAYGAKSATKDKVIAAAKAARCHDFISHLPDGYDTMVGEAGATLSGGEKQRVSIARAILKDAPIILLDEATASVDPENEHLIQDAINALVESKTLIIIAHRLSTITSADQIIVLNSRGSIEEVGKHEDLLKGGGLYSRFWERRQQARGWKVSQRNSGIQEFRD